MEPEGRRFFHHVSNSPATQDWHWRQGFRASRGSLAVLSDSQKPPDKVPYTLKPLLLSGMPSTHTTTVRRHSLTHPPHRAMRESRASRPCTAKAKDSGNQLKSHPKPLKKTCRSFAALISRRVSRASKRRTQRYLYRQTRAQAYQSGHCVLAQEPTAAYTCDTSCYKTACALPTEHHTSLEDSDF